MLTYRRKKTGQLLSIRWEKCMQDIVDKYPGNFSTYLLPIIIHIRRMKDYNIKIPSAW